MVAMEIGKVEVGEMCFVTNRKNNKAFGRIVLAGPREPNCSICDVYSNFLTRLKCPGKGRHRHTT